jgi:hypothetical protein
VAKSFAGIESFGEETVAVDESVVAPRDDGMLDTTVIVAEVPEFIVVVSEQVTVPFAPTDGVVHDHPGGALNETNVVGAGNGRSAAALTAVLGPLLVTVIVQVRFVPAFTGSGDAERAMLKSSEGWMSTSTAKLLSWSLGSGVVLLTVAIVLNVPDAVGGEDAVMVNKSEPGASAGAVQVIVAATVPGAIELHDQPAGTISDWKAIPAGSGKLSDGFAAASGPSLSMWMT